MRISSCKDTPTSLITNDEKLAVYVLYAQAVLHDAGVAHNAGQVADDDGAAEKLEMWLMHHQSQHLQQVEWSG